jgi:hypothetical protein
VLYYGKSCARPENAQLKDYKKYQGNAFSKGVKVLE